MQPLNECLIGNTKNLINAAVLNQINMVHVHVTVIPLSPNMNRINCPD